VSVTSKNFYLKRITYGPSYTAVSELFHLGYLSFNDHLCEG